MIYNENKIYMKVWKVTPSEKYIDLRATTSKKDANGTYISSNWFPRVIAHAFNSLKDVKEGDKIEVTKSIFTNETYEKDGDKKSFFKFIITEASIANNEPPIQNERPANTTADPF